MINKFKKLFLVAFFSSISIVYLNSKITTTVALQEVWYDFEPSEIYTFSGSTSLVDGSVANKFYENVSSFLNQTKTSTNSLGVTASWDTLGNNYLDIIPEKHHTLKGIPTELSIWIWGNNTESEVSVIFTRGDRFSYTLPLGNLKYQGWKKKTVPIPGHVFEKSVTSINPLRKYTFDRIRIHTKPRQPVNNLYFFFDKLSIIQSIKLQNYDGYELEKIILDEISKSGGDNSTKNDNIESNNSNNDSDTVTN